MNNVFRQGLQKIVDERCTADSSLLSDLWQLQIQLNRGHFDEDWVQALMQPHGGYDVYDAFGFAMLWSKLLKGTIRHAVCEIGKISYRNSAIDQNHLILSSLRFIESNNGHPIRVRAGFSGGLADNDGFFEWFDPLAFHRTVAVGDSSRHSSGIDSVPPFCVPLEVGSTDIATSAAHIFAEGGLARWPSGQTRLYLFYMPRDEAILPHLRAGDGAQQVPPI